MEGMLYTVHLAAAELLRSPSMRISESEAKMLAIAYHNVSRHYVSPMSEKTADWIGLASAAFTIYGGRVLKIRGEREASKHNVETPQSENADLSSANNADQYAGGFAATLQ